MATSSVVATLTSNYGFSSHAPLAELVSRAASGALLLELRICGLANSAGLFYLQRSTAVGVTPKQSSRFDFLREDPNQPPSNATIYTEWVKPPAVADPSTTAVAGLFTAIRRVNFPVGVAPTVIWTFPKGLSFSATSSLVVAGYNATPPYSLWISAVIEE